MPNKKYIGCKSWLCHQCKHYQKFLTISSMQDLCWNRGCFYESDDKANQSLDPTMLCIFDEYFDGREQHCITKPKLDCKRCEIHELVGMSVLRILKGEKKKLAGDRLDVNLKMEE